MLQLSTFWPHLGALQAASSMTVEWGWTSPRKTELRMCPNPLQLRPARRRISAPSKLQRLQSCKTGITAQKEPATTPASAGRMLLSIYITLDRSFRAALRSSDQQHRQPQQTSGKNTHQNTNQMSGQSVQAKNVNSNAADIKRKVCCDNQSRV